jgi:hypothetical protein
MIREKPIYISTEVHRMLWILAKADKTSPKNEQDSRDSGIRIVTPDEIADAILRQAIREQHPQLPERLAEIDRMEKEIIKSL